VFICGEEEVSLLIISASISNVEAPYIDSKQYNNNSNHNNNNNGVYYDCACVKFVCNPRQ